MRVLQRVVLLAVVAGGAASPAGAALPDSLTGRAVAFTLQYGTPLQYGTSGAHSPSGDSTAQDRWLAADKAKHVGGSFLWTLSTQYVLVVKAGWTDEDALPLSIASASAAGLAKELYDRHAGPTGVFSPKDLAADATGIVLAAGVILLL